MTDTQEQKQCVTTHTHNLSFDPDMNLRIGVEGPFRLTRICYAELEQRMGFSLHAWVRGMPASIVADELNRRLRRIRAKVTITITEKNTENYTPPFKKEPHNAVHIKGHVQTIFHSQTNPSLVEVLQLLTIFLAHSGAKLDELVCEAIQSTIDVDLKILFPHNPWVTDVKTSRGDLRFIPGLGVRIFFDDCTHLRISEFWSCPAIWGGFTGIERKEATRFNQQKLPSTTQNIGNFIQRRIQEVQKRWPSYSLLIPDGLTQDNPVIPQLYTVTTNKKVWSFVEHYMDYFTNHFETRSALALALASTTAHFRGKQRYSLELYATKMLGIIDVHREAIIGKGNRNKQLQTTKAKGSNK